VHPKNKHGTTTFDAVSGAKLGNKVWFRQHPLSKAAEGFAAKLAPKYDGPYTVTRFTSPNLVLLRCPGKRRLRSANISQLKPYYSEDVKNAAEEEGDKTIQGDDKREQAGWKVTR